jgi:competence protein ComEC
VVFLDVGQGDAVLIRDRGESWLIDGGGWSAPGFGSRVLIPALAGLGVRRVDGVIATHGDADHCGGLVDLLREIRVARALVPAGSESEPCIAELARSSPVAPMVAGAGFRVGRLELEVLAPGPRHHEPGNDASLVLRLAGLGRSFLFTGDVERRGELLLVLESEPQALEVDVLKVAHHGSHSSTSPRFLERARPAWAVVSAGRHNPFGHPAPVVLARLMEAGAVVRRTDLDGQIRFRWDQGSWWVEHGDKQEGR